jgi:hypothetical protein
MQAGRRAAADPCPIGSRNMGRVMRSYRDGWPLEAGAGGMEMEQATMEGFDTVISGGDVVDGKDDGDACDRCDDDCCGDACCDRGGDDENKRFDGDDDVDDDGRCGADCECACGCGCDAALA